MNYDIHVYRQEGITNYHISDRGDTTEMARTLSWSENIEVLEVREDVPKEEVSELLQKLKTSGSIKRPTTAKE